MDAYCEDDFCSINYCTQTAKHVCNFASLLTPVCEELTIMPLCKETMDKIT